MVILLCAALSTLAAAYVLWKEALQPSEAGMAGQSQAVFVGTLISVFLLCYAVLRLHLLSADGFQGTLLSSAVVSTLLLQAIYLIGLVQHGLRGLGLFLLPLSAVPLLLITLLPQESNVHWVQTSSMLETSHLLLSLLAYALLTIAALHALMYLLVNSALKRKQLSGWLQAMPSLFDIEAYMCKQLQWSVALLAAGIVSGLLWQWAEFAHFALWNHKVLLAFFAFALLVMVLVRRQTSSWYGRKTSMVILGAYVVLMLAYFGVKIIHSWGG